MSGIMKKLLNAASKVPVCACRTLWKMGKDDPRRVIHGIKVGAALTLVSLLYLLEPLFQEVGQNATWAVMTVVVVFEFTAGATLGKGLNRGLGTLSAGSLAFFIDFVAEETGQIGRAVFVGTSVFLIGFLATYLRFVPYIKKNYDYGVVIFLITFNLIIVSSYRVKNVLEIAQQRAYMIGIGCGICLLMTLFIFPNWSGEDLHSLSISRLDGLAKSVEVCVDEYFKDKATEVTEEEVEGPNDTICKGYRAVLDSKTSDENLAHFASWEPRLSRNCQKHPWHMYVRLGGVLRHFACTMVALHGCLDSEIQAPMSVRALFREPCNRLAKEMSKALEELAISVQNRRLFSRNVLAVNINDALQGLLTAVKSQPRLFLGSRSTNNMLYTWKSETEPSPKTPGSKNDYSALILELRNKKVVLKQPNEMNNNAVNKELRPTFSKLAITSLEFSEALPFAAFVSLLVEMVVRLDHVIEQVEELGKAACFKEYVGNDDDIAIDVSERLDGKEIQNHSQLGDEL